METKLVKSDSKEIAFNREQVELIKRTVAKGATDDELMLFQHICQKTGLDPFARQIYAIKRWSKKDNREVMSIQTGIDGYRLVADRTNAYAPGAEPTFAYDGGSIVSATAHIKKLVAGTWHEISATAHYAEYVQQDRDGNPTKFWLQMPHVMLGKVAEALALRRAFPAELSGVYTHEEMSQAYDETPKEPEKPAELPPLPDLPNKIGPILKEVQVDLSTVKLLGKKQKGSDEINHYVITFETKDGSCALMADADKSDLVELIREERKNGGMVVFQLEDNRLLGAKFEVKDAKRP